MLLSNTTQDVMQSVGGMSGVRPVGVWYAMTTAAALWRVNLSTSALNCGTRVTVVTVSTPMTVTSASVLWAAAVRRARNIASHDLLTSTSRSLPWPSSSHASYCCFVSAHQRLKGGGVTALYGKPISELQSVTCRMGLHSCQCYRHRWTRRVL